jgi:hypothetical protein
MRDAAERRRLAQGDDFGGLRALLLDALDQLGGGDMDGALIEPAGRRPAAALDPRSRARVAVQPRLARRAA